MADPLGDLLHQSGADPNQTVDAQSAASHLAGVVKFLAAEGGADPIATGVTTPKQPEPVQDATQPASQGQQQGGQATDTGKFAQDLLAGIGAPDTPENERVISAWMRAEGGADHNNPLNTTQDAPGASNFNDVGVKTYTSYEQGVQATVQTLLNGMYGNIIDTLRKGSDANAVADAIAASPWGTGGLVKKIIEGGD